MIHIVVSEWSHAQQRVALVTVRTRRTAVRQTAPQTTHDGAAGCSCGAVVKTRQRRQCVHSVCLISCAFTVLSPQSVCCRVRALQQTTAAMASPWRCTGELEPHTTSLGCCIHGAASHAMHEVSTKSFEDSIAHRCISNLVQPVRAWAGAAIGYDQPPRQRWVPTRAPQNIVLLWSAHSTHTRTSQKSQV
jgi:hypothetical protein